MIDKTKATDLNNNFIKILNKVDLYVFSSFSKY